MKTYRWVDHSSVVRKGDRIVDFYFESDEVWGIYEVVEVSDKGITLYCPSKALFFTSNEELSEKPNYFKRVE